MADAASQAERAEQAEPDVPTGGRPMIPADDERALLSAVARLYARRRRIVERTCVGCGRPIVGTVRRQYCTPTCRSAHWQRTHRERVNAYRRRWKGRQDAGGAGAGAERESRGEATDTGAEDATGPDT